MKQPSMFHENDMARFYNDSSSDDRDNDFHHDPLSPVFEAIQKHRIPKNNISDPVRVIIHNFIKLAGVTQYQQNESLLYYQKKMNMIQNYYRTCQIY